MQDLLLSTVTVIPAGDFSVDVPWARSCGGWNCQDKKQFATLVRTLTSVSKWTCTAAFALEKMVNKSSEAFLDKESELRPEVNFVTEVFAHIGASPATVTDTEKATWGGRTALQVLTP